LVISFVPEVGSEVIKEDIYRRIVSHAVDINKFFPKVKKCKYSVLWDDHKQAEVIQLIINETGVEQLSKKYSDLLMDEKVGITSSYRSFFSVVEESGVAKKWRTK